MGRAQPATTARRAWGGRHPATAGVALLQLHSKSSDEVEAQVERAQPAGAYMRAQVAPKGWICPPIFPRPRNHILLQQRDRGGQVLPSSTSVCVNNASSN